jgi:hypothetical protein
MKKTKTKSVNVIFRLLEDEYQKLKENGETLDQSPGQSARRLVRDGLRKTRQKGLGKRIDGLETKLDAVTEKMELLIETLELSTQVLLAHAGRLTEDEAEIWIKKSFH